MGVPKKGLTKGRIGKRRSTGHGKAEKMYLGECVNCGAVIPHAVICHVCGHYKGKKVIAKLI